MAVTTRSDGQLSVDGVVIGNINENPELKNMSYAELLEYASTISTGFGAEGDIYDPYVVGLQPYVQPAGVTLPEGFNITDYDSVTDRPDTFPGVDGQGPGYYNAIHGTDFGPGSRDARMVDWASHHDASAYDAHLGDVALPEVYDPLGIGTPGGGTGGIAVTGAGIAGAYEVIGPTVYPWMEEIITTGVDIATNIIDGATDLPTDIEGGQMANYGSARCALQIGIQVLALIQRSSQAGAAGGQLGPLNIVSNTLQVGLSNLGLGQNWESQAFGELAEVSMTPGEMVRQALGCGFLNPMKGRDQPYISIPYQSRDPHASFANRPAARATRRRVYPTRRSSATRRTGGRRRS